MRGKNFLRLTLKRKEEVITYALKRRWSWKKFERYYKQPPWCNYPDALRFGMGCWSLVGYGSETNKWHKDKCPNCELSNHYINREVKL